MCIEAFLSTLDLIAIEEIGEGKGSQKNCIKYLVQLFKK